MRRAHPKLLSLRTSDISIYPDNAHMHLDGVQASIRNRASAPTRPQLQPQAQERSRNERNMNRSADPGETWNRRILQNASEVLAYAVRCNARPSTRHVLWFIFRSFALPVGAAAD